MKTKQQLNLLYRNNPDSYREKGRIWSALFFLFFFSVNSQNLVPNNYFETYSTCPNSIGQLAFASGWSNAASGTSPDYFNSCASYTTDVSVPVNAFGYQQDCCGGNGYAGIYTFNKAFPNDGRDYIQVKLNNTLIAGKKYLAGMYVSPEQNYDYCISTMGMYFTPNAIQAPGSAGFINVTNPQVKNTTPLTDTLNWILVQDTITAVGTELYLTIGNFSFDSFSDTVYTNNGGGFSPYAYYFIDNVFVVDAAFAGINENTKENEIKIFPNPAKDQINISCVKCENNLAPVMIYDIAGKLISSLKMNLNNGTGSFDLNVENGIYFVKIGDNENQSTVKLIIQH